MQQQRQAATNVARPPSHPSKPKAGFHPTKPESGLVGTPGLPGTPVSYPSKPKAGLPGTPVSAAGPASATEEQPANPARPAASQPAAGGGRATPKSTRVEPLKAKCAKTSCLSTGVHPIPPSPAFSRLLPRKSTLQGPVFVVEAGEADGESGVGSQEPEARSQKPEGVRRGANCPSRHLPRPPASACECVMGLRPTKVDENEDAAHCSAGLQAGCGGGLRPAHECAAGVDAASTAGLETSATFFDGAGRKTRNPKGSQDSEARRRKPEGGGLEPVAHPFLSQHRGAPHPTIPHDLPRSPAKIHPAGPWARARSRDRCAVQVCGCAFSCNTWVETAFIRQVRAAGTE
jgi:hypothetical protein